MNADEHSTIAGRELLGIIHELEAEEAVIRDHNKAKSDIIKEAGNKGYDKKTIRKVMAARRLDPLERGEQDNLFDIYMHAVEIAEKEVAHARVENAGKFGAAKPVTDTQEQPETADEVPAQDGSGTATGESPSGKSHAAHPVSEQELADADLNDGTAAGQTAIEVVTAGETAPLSPSPETPQAIADGEAAQANPTSSAPISNPQEPNSSPAADSPALTSSPEPGSLSEKKGCLKLKDGHCKISFDTPALCSVCNAERMKARAA